MKAIQCALAGLCCLLCWPLQANVVINTTRVVYPGNAREITVALNNGGPAPALVQAWLDEGDPDARPDHTRVPFILLPPIFRLDPQQAQALRLTYSQSRPLPQDRESLFWLNVLDIPAKPDDSANYLQLAIRSRLKLFYRPASLKADVRQAPARLQIRLENQGLRLENPTPFYVTLTELQLTQGEHTQPLDSLMLAPFASERLPLALPVTPGPLQLTFKSIDDYGALRPQQLAVAR
ncbi:fimbria/pilus periplasmic chaperone [Pseudaeromonas sp. ZJS20]|uniref:fimbrial biogenesis chaperone n=1 Tax=Pseudaeromonas aegiceratis TaxID=3153928 RepID=UPI00390C835E